MGLQTYTTDVDNDGTIETADGDAVIAMIGLRRGGKAFYALDVSDPDTPKFKWKIEKGTAVRTMRKWDSLGRRRTSETCL